MNNYKWVINRTVRTFVMKYTGVKLTKGETGKTAYQSAVDGGYLGTELQFNADFLLISEKENTGVAARLISELVIPSIEGLATTLELEAVQETIPVIDPNTVIDPSYTHTDNNYSSPEKVLVATIPNLVVKSPGKSLLLDTEIERLQGLENVDISGLATISSLATTDAIARGKSRATVYTTLADLNTFLSVPANLLTLQLGDNFYVRDLTSSDYWWDGASKQPLEGEKVDLTNYVQKVTGKDLSDNNFTTLLKNAYDSVVLWVSTNGANVLTHIADNAKHITSGERTTWNGQTNETLSSIGTIAHSATVKTILVDADETTGTDSSNSFGLSRTTWLNVWTNYLKVKNDLIYVALLTLYNQPIRTIAVSAYAIDLTTGEDFTKTCATLSAFTISNPITKKPFRLILTGGTLAATLITGYTNNWAGGSLITDYIPANTNYLWCEIKSAGQITLSWGW